MKLLPILPAVAAIVSLVTALPAETQRDDEPTTEVSKTKIDVSKIHQIIYDATKKSWNIDIWQMPSFQGEHWTFRAEEWECYNLSSGKDWQQFTWAGAISSFKIPFGAQCGFWEERGCDGAATFKVYDDYWWLGEWDNRIMSFQCWSAGQVPPLPDSYHQTRNGN